MTIKKPCICCGERKSLDAFYTHKQMADGRLNKCKACCRSQAFERWHVNKKDADWLGRERTRCRNKYHRLDYKDRRKYNPIAQRNYRDRFPEKYRSRNLSQHIDSPPGFEKHHWSYNEKDAKDVIFLTIEDHNMIHRFLIYDVKTSFYKTKDGALLDTRGKHEAFIDKIKNKRRSAPLHRASVGVCMENPRGKTMQIKTDPGCRCRCPGPFH